MATYEKLLKKSKRNLEAYKNQKYFIGKVKKVPKTFTTKKIPESEKWYQNY